MNPFQEKITAWLSRPSPERAINQCFDIPVVLATDIGLQRSENQDRVAALRISSKCNGGRPLVAIAVADGMGGMRDGARCATLALSSFFYALTLYRSHDLQRRAVAAISFANSEVFKFAGGRGGATLSSVLLDSDLRPFVVNLGDSRVYAFGEGMKVQRLTRDDSLAEAVGGHGRDLLQFIGMGEGMQPYVQAVETGIHKLAITTDGIHFVEASTLENILSHTVELKSASERLAALARWCGGADNASSAMIDLRSLLEEIGRDDNSGIELWDPFGSLAPIWMKDDLPDSDSKAMKMSAVHQSIAPPTAESSAVSQHESSKSKAVSKKGKKAKKQGPPKEDIQLEIQIERSPNSDDTDENGR
jgi:serine/threonine protein phosphatase PrpC